MKLQQPIPGNFEHGIIRDVQIQLDLLDQPLIANELLECELRGEANSNYGELGPNLISCRLDQVTFPQGVSHFDVKDTILVDCEIMGRFDRVFITHSGFRGCAFSKATMRDTVIADSTLEKVTFTDCDFAVTTFKSNVYYSCKFINCLTTNKLFEHCVLVDCVFENTALQEITILQNFGIRLACCTDLVLTRSGTDERVHPTDIIPRNQLEEVSAEYFWGFDLNDSDALLAVVQWQFKGATSTNILHVATGIRQLSLFLVQLSNRGEVLPIFPLQLFWSLDRILASHLLGGIPQSIQDSLDTAHARLRVVHETLTAAISPDPLIRVLVAETVSREELESIIRALDLDVQILRFERFNSPSLVELFSSEHIEKLTLVLLFLATSFHFEIDHHRPGTKLLDLETKLLEQRRSTGPSSIFHAVIAVNVPKMIYMRISAQLSLSLLNRLRRLAVTVLSDEAATRKGPVSGAQERSQGAG